MASHSNGILKMKTVIHVNMHKIRRNTKTGEKEPVITCKNYKENRYGHEALIYDSLGNVAAKVVYNPDKPLSCGARVWIETENEVKVIDHGHKTNKACRPRSDDEGRSKSRRPSRCDSKSERRGTKKKGNKAKAPCDMG